MRMRSFGRISDGRSAGLYILRNANGMEVSVTDYGAALVSVLVPGKDDRPVDVVLGYSDVSAYENGDVFYGATVGRVANRIGEASFTLNGHKYELTANDSTNCLHGGRDFYNKRLWDTKIPFTSISSGDVAKKANAVESMNDGGFGYVQDDVSGDSVIFLLDSPDGDQGYPGNLSVEVQYTLTNSNELHIDYRALSDKDTPLSLTNHSYFNLSGHTAKTVLDHLCSINADCFTEIDEKLLPTGALIKTAGTPMDFREPKTIGQDIGADYSQLKICGCYDHNFVLSGEGYKEVSALESPVTGIRMRVFTDMPGMQLYTGSGNAACFETQYWPDAINKADFPGGVLKAGEKFVSRTTYSFEPGK